MNSMQRASVLLGFVLCAAACGAGDVSVAENTPQILTEVPAEIDPSARYLFYLHGAIIERAGVRPTHPEFGVYEYQEILEVFASRGFVVISEARAAGTDPMKYAESVVGQVRALLAAEVPPGNIAVVGFSKGGGIAVVASSILVIDGVNFVFIGTCGPWLNDRPEIVPHGRMLSLHELSDDMVGSCETLFARSTGASVHEEITLDLGGGHGAFYRPRSEWIDPVVEWTN